MLVFTYLFLALVALCYRPLPVKKDGPIITFTDKPKRASRVINRSGVFNSKSFNSYENLKKSIDKSL